MCYYFTRWFVVYPGVWWSSYSPCSKPGYANCRVSLLPMGTGLCIWDPITTKDQWLVLQSNFNILLSFFFSMITFLASSRVWGGTAPALFPIVWSLCDLQRFWRLFDANGNFCYRSYGVDSHFLHWLWFFFTNGQVQDKQFIAQRTSPMCNEINRIV